MMDFENKYYLLLLGIVPVLVFLYIKYRNKQAEINLKLGDDKLIRKLTYGRKTYFYLLKFLLVVLAFISLVISLANPRLPGEKRAGAALAKAEIVFAVDVSKSMLARDIAPNRLARAQSFILGALNHFHGEQVSIVIFAGKADIYVPLSADYNFAGSAVKNISNNLVVKQGTSIRDALKISSLVLNNKSNDVKIICLLSDGETPETNLESLADTVRRSGIHLFAFGLGTPGGANIIEQGPDGNDVIKLDKNGSLIISRLHEENLLKVVKNQPNRYYRLADKELAIDALINEVQALKHNSKTVVYVQKECFQLFLLMVMFLLVMEIFIP